MMRELLNDGRGRFGRGRMRGSKVRGAQLLFLVSDNPNGLSVKKKGKGRWGCVLPGGLAGTDSLTGFGDRAAVLWTS